MTFRLSAANSLIGRLLAMEGVQNGRPFSVGAISATFHDTFPAKCPEYDQSVAALNSLQTFISFPKSGYKQSSEIAYLMAQWLECLGYSLNDLDRLRAVHVSGTKGKGSTCAITESMLRNCGLKTGLFTSPHLRQARERIRLNGVPISPQSFASYFSSVHGRLKENSKLPLPGYFHFLTLMAFEVFLKEGIDVAIVEVGIGGEYDATNVIRKPVVCGVTSLGLDHVGLLGDTLPKIAWHKAGIFKGGVPAFTVPQAEEAMRVLFERAAKAECPLSVVPPYESYFSDSNGNGKILEGAFVPLGGDGNVQGNNASLALQLVRTWKNSAANSENVLKTSEITAANSFNPEEWMIKGLKSCHWPGRFQRISRPPFTFWVDGAHTTESIQLCGEWYFNSNKKCNEEPSVLLFNTTGPRNSEDFISLLIQIGRAYKANSFSLGLFCPTVSRLPPAPDSAYNVTSHNDQVARCAEIAKYWLEVTVNESSSAATATTVYEALATIQDRFPKGCNVLVTGSLHLVGALLEALDEPVV